MSLVKKQKMTEKKLAANRRNQKLSHGLLTEEGRERIRAAHLRHGFYAQAEESALRSLGEDPAQFQELLEGLWGEFTPVGSLQEGLVIRLARATWLMNRADRIQEGYALRQANDASTGRENRLHARMMRLKMTSGCLQSLARSVAREHYVTRPNDLELMKGLQKEPELEEMGEICVAFFTQLQDPGAFDEAGRPKDTYEAQEKVLYRIKEIFGLTGPYAPQPDAAPGAGQGTGNGQGTGATDKEEENPFKRDPYRHITPEQWALREPVRQLLENILTHQAELCEAMRQALLKEAVSGPSPYERAAQIAPTHRDAQLMRRMQDSNFREVRRVTRLLLKIQRRAQQTDALEDSG